MTTSIRRLHKKREGGEKLGGVLTAVDSPDSHVNVGYLKKSKKKGKWDKTNGTRTRAIFWLRSRGRGKGKNPRHELLLRLLRGRELRAGIYTGKKGGQIERKSVHMSKKTFDRRGGSHQVVKVRGKRSPKGNGCDAGVKTEK